MLLGLNISNLHGVNGSVYRNLFGTPPKHAWYHVADALRTSYPLRFESFARGHLHDDPLFYQSEPLSCAPTSVVCMPHVTKQQAHGDETESCFSGVTSVDDPAQDGEIEEQHIEYINQPDFNEDAHNDMNSDTSDSEDERHSNTASLFTAEHERQLQEDEVFWDAPQAEENTQNTLPTFPTPIEMLVATPAELTTQDDIQENTIAPWAQAILEQPTTADTDTTAQALEKSTPIEMLVPTPAELTAQDDIQENTIAPWAQAILEQPTTADMDITAQATEQPITEEQAAALHDEIDNLEEERNAREVLPRNNANKETPQSLNKRGPDQKELSELERYFIEKRLERFLNEQLDEKTVKLVQDIISKQENSDPVQK